MKDLKFRDLFNLLAFPFFVYMLGYALEAGWADYKVIFWPNRIVHFLGGLSIAVTAYFILQKIKNYNVIKTNTKLADFFLILFFVMSITVFWEFYEFLSDKYLFTSAQPSVADTMKDMFMGMLGAISFGVGWAVSYLFKPKKAVL